MRKMLLSFGLALSFGLFGVNAYSQVTQDSIPKQVEKKAIEYLKYVPYCDTIPKLEIIAEKFEDRTGPRRIEDGIKDRIRLYKINNKCEWTNVYNYIIFIQRGLGDGKFAERGIFEGIISKDKDGKPIPLERDW